MGLEFRERAWPLPVHTLTSSPASFQEVPYSDPRSASLLSVAEETHIQRSMSPPPLTPRVSLLLPGAWPERVCTSLLEAHAALPPERKRQTHTSRPCPTALLFRAAEQIAAAREARARGGEGRGARALARRRAWQLSPARGTGRRVGGARLPVSCSTPARGLGARHRRSWARQAASPLWEGRSEAECKPPRGGAAACSTRALSLQTRGQGRQAAELLGWKHEAVGGFPGLAIILGSERRGEQTAADLERF